MKQFKISIGIWRPDKTKNIDFTDESIVKTLEKAIEHYNWRFKRKRVLMLENTYPNYFSIMMNILSEKELKVEINKNLLAKKLHYLSKHLYHDCGWRYSKISGRILTVIEFHELDETESKTSMEPIVPKVSPEQIKLVFDYFLDIIAEEVKKKLGLELENVKDKMVNLSKDVLFDIISQKNKTLESTNEAKKVKASKDDLFDMVSQITRPLDSTKEKSVTI